MPQLPAHGSIRRYKSGCRCKECTAKNTAEKAKERERKRTREGHPAARVPRAPARVPTTPSRAPLEPEFGPIEQAARAALATEDDDKLAALRREVVFAAARLMDDPSMGRLFKGHADTIRVWILDIVAQKPPEDGEADALRDFLGAIGSTRGRRGAAAVDDAEKSGA